MTDAVAARHTIERVRREPKRRRLTVVDRPRSDAEDAPHRVRLARARRLLRASASTTTSSCSRPTRPRLRGFRERDYTPRAYDAERCELTIDFALHDAGPATVWALAAKPGDELQIGGPRGSMVVADDFDFYLLIGDETALPAIGRRVEALRAGVPVFTIVVVDGPEEAQRFETRADWRPVWVYRDSESDAELLRAALWAWTAPQGDGYVWIAAEAKVARALKDYMLGERSHPKAWLKASGYWVDGKAGVSEKFDD